MKVRNVKRILSRIDNMINKKHIIGCENVAYSYVCIVVMPELLKELSHKNVNRVVIYEGRFCKRKTQINNIINKDISRLKTIIKTYRYEKKLFWRKDK